MSASPFRLPELAVYSETESRARLKAYIDTVRTEPITDFERFEHVVGQDGLDVPRSLGSLILYNGEQITSGHTVTAYGFKSRNKRTDRFEAFAGWESHQGSLGPQVYLQARKRRLMAPNERQLLNFPSDDLSWCQIITYQKPNHVHNLMLECDPNRFARFDDATMDSNIHSWHGDAVIPEVGPTLRAMELQMAVNTPKVMKDFNTISSLLIERFLDATER